MTRIFKATIVTLILAQFSGALSDDEMYAHLPKLEEVKAYFVERRASLDTLFELYAADTRISWLECDGNGQYRITTTPHNTEFTPAPYQTQIF
tara:strand:- start:9827 stop:10105 length:279 start_codon:yes stop_codon:yes gene_type:complete